MLLRDSIRQAWKSWPSLTQRVFELVRSIAACDWICPTDLLAAARSMDWRQFWVQNFCHVRPGWSLQRQSDICQYTCTSMALDFIGSASQPFMGALTPLLRPFRPGLSKVTLPLGASAKFKLGAWVSISTNSFWIHLPLVTVAHPTVLLWCKNWDSQFGGSQEYAGVFNVKTNAPTSWAIWCILQPPIRTSLQILHPNLQPAGLLLKKALAVCKGRKQNGPA